MPRRNDMDRGYASKLTTTTWTCVDCPKHGNASGHYPARSHARATGHRVLVTQTVEYLYHYPQSPNPQHIPTGYH